MIRWDEETRQDHADFSYHTYLMTKLLYEGLYKDQQMALKVHKLQETKVQIKKLLQLKIMMVMIVMA